MAGNRDHFGTVAVIGDGPAELMAAEVASNAGARVDVYDAMPSMGRKFLMADKGGLNLTHAERRESFLSRPDTLILRAGAKLGAVSFLFPP